MNKNVLSLKEFTYLMLATIAKDSTVKDLKRPDIKICHLPANYKQCIENILCAPNRWNEFFDKLIDVEKYFEDHFAWEQELSDNIKQALTELKKEIKFDLESDKLLIEFKQNEIDAILSKFAHFRKKEMEHFSDLVTDVMYQRKYQHEQFDHSARAIAKMKTIREKRQESQLDPMVK